MYRLKRFISFLLIALIMLSIIPLNTIFAYPPPQVITFTKENDYQGFKYHTEANSGKGTTFRTIGWNIKYRPTSVDSWKSVYIGVAPDANKIEDYTIWISTRGQETNYKLTDKFVESIESKISTSDKVAFETVMFNGGLWEFNARVQVYVDGHPQADKIANTLTDALNLAAWGGGTIDDFYKWYYLRQGTSEPEPIGVDTKFKIMYKNTDQTDKSIQKDFDNLGIVLQDTGTVSKSSLDPVTDLIWYYKNSSGVWKPLSGMSGVDISTDKKTVTITDCDTNLLGSLSTKKDFRLEARTQYGNSGTTDHSLTFTVTNAIITVNYQDIDTGNALYADDNITAPLNVPYTVTNAKATPAGYTAVNNSSQTITPTPTDSNPQVYFFYSKFVAGQGRVNVFYKKSGTSIDIQTPSALIYPYGTYTIDRGADIAGYTYASSVPTPPTVTLSVSNTTQTVTFYYNQINPKLPPEAMLKATGSKVTTAMRNGDVDYYEVQAGNDFYLNATDSYAVEPGANIKQYNWDIGGFTPVGSISNKVSKQKVYSLEVDDFYENPNVEVVDSNGMTDSSDTRIHIKAPTPEAVITVTGDLRENRKVNISDLKSIVPDHFPIKESKTRWTIAAVIGGTAYDIKYSGILNSTNVKDILFKKAGVYQITLYIELDVSTSTEPNSIFSDTAVMDITINPDEAPIADFNSPTIILRNPDNTNKANITVTNTSYSPDGDTIGKSACIIAYDTDNDGNYDEESAIISINGTTWTATGKTYAQIKAGYDIYSLSASNPKYFSFDTTEVGKYMIAILAIDDIPADTTIPAFIDSSDNRRGNSFTKDIAHAVIEVQNVAPQVQFEAKPRRPVDVIVLTSYTGQKLTDLQTSLNTFKANTIPLNINTTVNYVTASMKYGTILDRQFLYARMLKYSSTWSQYTSFRADGSSQQTAPKLKTQTYMIESATKYESESGTLPVRNPTNISFARGGSYTVNESPYQYYRYNLGISWAGDIISSYNMICTFMRNKTTDGSGYEYESFPPSNESVAVDTKYKPQYVTATSNKDLNVLDIDQIKTITLTPNSTRYLLIVDDGVGKYFLNSWGSYYSAINMDTTFKAYLTANNIKVKVVTDQKNLDTLFDSEKIIDIATDGDSISYLTNDGRLLQQGGSYGAYGDYPVESENISGFPTELTPTLTPVPNSTLNQGNGYVYINSSDHKVHYASNNAVLSTETARITALIPNTNAIYYLTDSGNLYDISGLTFRGSQGAPGTLIASSIQNIYNYAGNALLVKFNDGTYKIMVSQWTGDYYKNSRRYIVTLIASPFSSTPLGVKSTSAFTYYGAYGLCYQWSTLDGNGDLIEQSYYKGSMAYSSGFSVRARGIKDIAPMYNNGETYPDGYVIDNNGNVSMVDVLNCSIYNNNIYTGIAKIDSIPLIEGGTYGKAFFLRNDGTVFDETGANPLKNRITWTVTGKTYISARDLVNSNAYNMSYGKGAYQTAVTAMQTELTRSLGSTESYVLTTETVDYTKFYSDYENDTEHSFRWYYSHDPNHFENSNGIETRAGVYISSPITQFPKVGKYEITAQGRDNPKANDLFDNYRLWSPVSDKLILYVHRKPVAVMRLSISNNGNGTYTVVAIEAGSYDLDHYSRADKGIAASEWQWKSSTDTTWTAGRMNKSNCDPTLNYTVQYRVQDLEGAWSDWNTKIINNGTPPVALFTLDKMQITVTEKAMVKDQSYPLSFTNLTRWHWIVKKLNEDGSVPAGNTQNTIFTNSNTGSGTMSGYDVNVKNDYSDTGEGTYRIYLRVKDANGLWSDGGTDSGILLNNFFSQDIYIVQGQKLQNFRITMVYDFHLSDFYKNNTSKNYENKLIYVKNMAVDENNYFGMVESLARGYKFDFEIDSTGFNEENDTIVCTPHFYSCDLFSRDNEERQLFWQNSGKEILKAGSGGHSNWNIIVLNKENRTIIDSEKALWKGSYFIPATSWLTPLETNNINAKKEDLKKDIIVNFEIKGFKNSTMKFDYNQLEWPLERTNIKSPYKIGDVIKYSHSRNNLEDEKVIRNRP